MVHCILDCSDLIDKTDAEGFGTCPDAALCYFVYSLDCHVPSISYKLCELAVDLLH